MRPLILIALAAGGAPSWAGDLEGTVVARTVPPAVLAHITIDRHVCGQSGMVFESTVAVSRDGLVDGALVFLEPRAPALSLPPRAGKGPRPKPTAVLIDQKNCGFVPRLLAAERGAPIRLRNSDPVFHNVHLFDEQGATVANVSMPLVGQEVQAFLADRAGRFSVRCDAGHKWMHADLLVFDHPYFSSTKNGRYRIPRVPPGSYWLVAFHPVLGEKREPLEIPTKDDLIVRSVEF